MSNGLFGLGDFGNLLGTGAAIYGLSRLGRTPTPSVQEKTGEALTAFRENYPAYAEMLRQEAGRELARQQELYPEQLKLAQQQLGAARAFVPQYGQLASDEAYREAMSEAGKQVDVLRGPGGQLIDEAYAKAQQVDPEFYGQRAQAGALLGDLLRSFTDPETGRFTGELSGGERAEVERQVNRARQMRGGLGGPQNVSDIVSQAMQFGQAAQRKRDQLGQALGVATSFLPASRSGFDPLQVALGRPSQQFGAQQFAPPTAVAPTQGAAGQFMGNVMAGARQSAGFQAAQPSLLTNIGSVAKTFPGLAGGLSW
jgi:hypothetical protein